MLILSIWRIYFVFHGQVTDFQKDMSLFLHAHVHMLLVLEQFGTPAETLLPGNLNNLILIKSPGSCHSNQLPHLTTELWI